MKSHGLVSLQLAKPHQLTYHAYNCIVSILDSLKIPPYNEIVSETLPETLPCSAHTFVHHKANSVYKCLEPLRHGQQSETNDSILHDNVFDKSADQLFSH